MTTAAERTPGRAWIVVAAGTAVNLCLGILYAWSVWKASLVATADHPAGSAMQGLNDGWTYLTDSQGTWAYSICGVMFALFMIPGGIVQDRWGPKVGATLSGLLLASGCVLAGVMKSFLGLILGFGLLGGIGMGLGYAAATPAAVRWFGPHRRGLIVGLVVGGYGGAAIYISPLAKQLISTYGLSGCFIALGLLFGAVIVMAAQFLSMPPSGYQPAGKPSTVATSTAPATDSVDWPVPAMVRTPQFFALVVMFIGSAQSGLLVIANAALILKSLQESNEFLAAHAWLLASYGGLMNAAGRIGTGLYSDKIGRTNAYLLNGVVSATCLLATPWILGSDIPALLFLTLGVAYWQYGGGLALMPAFTADFFGAKDLGFKYGLVFLGWGIAFFVPQLAGYVKERTGTLDVAFYASGAGLIAAVLLCLLVRRPTMRAGSH